MAQEGKHLQAMGGTLWKAAPRRVCQTVAHHVLLAAWGTSMPGRSCWGCWAARDVA
jgi:hypothetical protein